MPDKYQWPFRRPSDRAIMETVCDVLDRMDMDDLPPEVDAAKATIKAWYEKRYGSEKLDTGKNQA